MSLLLLLSACTFAPVEGIWNLTVQTDTVWDCTLGSEYYAAGESWEMIVYWDNPIVSADLGHDPASDDCDYSEPDLNCTETRVNDYTGSVDAVITWVDELDVEFMSDSRFEGKLYTELYCEGSDCNDRALQFAPSETATWPCMGETNVYATPQ
ncbi:MAG: hypothetical protein VX899_08955 [Myxococcota bacterium]|nr:hypothetical protein [Myxococcota bacterium]